MGIAAMATMVVILLQFNSSRKHEQKEVKKKKEEAREQGGGGGNGGSGDKQQRLGVGPITSVGYDASKTAGQQEALGGELLATEGVSLG
jgi:hypothetical protein